MTSAAIRTCTPSQTGAQLQRHSQKRAFQSTGFVAVVTAANRLNTADCTSQLLSPAASVCRACSSSNNEEAASSAPNTSASCALMLRPDSRKHHSCRAKAAACSSRKLWTACTMPARNACTAHTQQLRQAAERRVSVYQSICINTTHVLLQRTPIQHMLHTWQAHMHAATASTRCSIPPSQLLLMHVDRQTLCLTEVYNDTQCAQLQSQRHSRAGAHTRGWCQGLCTCSRAARRAVRSP